jgi:hypothetical protein
MEDAESQPSSLEARSCQMKMTLHHLNLTTTNVVKMNDFYRNVMGLAAEPTLNSNRITTNQGYSGETAFATDGHIQVHMSERDLALGFRQKQFVNPLERDISPFGPTILPASKTSRREGRALF